MHLYSARKLTYGESLWAGTIYNLCQYGRKFLGKDMLDYQIVLLCSHMQAPTWSMTIPMNMYE